MKKIVIIGLILFTAQFAQAQDKIEWLKFEEAVAAAEANPKMLLVDVYTDWCGWCKKMDKETFTDPDVIKYINEKFYAVKMNAEDDKRKFDFKGKDYTEAKMAAAMRVQSYPNFVIIDPTLKNITQLPGYRQPVEFLERLSEIVDNGIGTE
ncbi:thioredoxin fold domain-containing protein [Algoriphagus sp. D3-2-R+10]|uniref:thioredoxin family protein n=1 Tax=Algoriphagus aurantiacus TaxID=3103948 RepID=UPI002B384AA2|nr:thioredoxin fold domain-containing protein [Algoriphagus sp. D3-2-R+10]MEB2774276.1 thioredoxin fold domain-containing protein [Algoriphagus sp. D3-2-R+10]